jgi:hypothetical protein
MTPAAALRLYAKAQETHKRADWSMACNALAQALGEEAPKPREAKPVSLVTFLSKQGIADPGGELTARDADHWHKGQPFRRKLVRPDGRSLEDAAEAAHDAGYFPDVPDAIMDGPDNMTVITGEILMGAIERELSGRPVFAGPDQDSDYWAAMEPEEGDREYA